jgi:hypothetical protein
MPGCNTMRPSHEMRLDARPGSGFGSGDSSPARVHDESARAWPLLRRAGALAGGSSDRSKKDSVQPNGEVLDCTR